MGDWQNIASAPKDGSDIEILTSGGFEMLARYEHLGFEDEDGKSVGAWVASFEDDHPAGRTELAGNRMRTKSNRTRRSCGAPPRRTKAMAELTKAQMEALAELASYEARGRTYWWREASMRVLIEHGLAEQYALPPLADRPRMKRRPYRITPAGRAALEPRDER